MMLIEHKHGWLGVPIGTEYESLAKKFRAKRDKQYGNIYREHKTDARWVGDLGEFVFLSFSENYTNSKIDWITEHAAGKADFIIDSNISIGVKTVKRKVPPQKSYTAQITARHTKEPVDYYFFLTYEISNKIMWMLGGISKSEFLKHAVYYSDGDWVHPNYQIRRGHEIYNIEISKLLPPFKWLKHCDITVI